MSSTETIGIVFYKGLKTMTRIIFYEGFIRVDFLMMTRKSVLLKNNLKSISYNFKQISYLFKTITTKIIF
jgi:hypothetical protein